MTSRALPPVIFEQPKKLSLNALTVRQGLDTEIMKECL
jgi:hypothetical protein